MKNQSESSRDGHIRIGENRRREQAESNSSQENAMESSWDEPRGQQNGRYSLMGDQLDRLNQYANHNENQQQQQRPSLLGRQQDGQRRGADRRERGNRLDRTRDQNGQQQQQYQQQQQQQYQQYQQYQPQQQQQYQPSRFQDFSGQF